MSTLSTLNAESDRMLWELYADVQLRPGGADDAGQLQLDEQAVHIADRQAAGGAGVMDGGGLRAQGVQQGVGAGPPGGCGQCLLPRVLPPPLFEPQGGKDVARIRDERC